MGQYLESRILDKPGEMLFKAVHVHIEPKLHYEITENWWSSQTKGKFKIRMNSEYSKQKELKGWCKTGDIKGMVIWEIKFK